jgi:asparagine synthase (glutamine-hydrolysing)
MTGVLGGSVDEDELPAEVGSADEPWHETERSAKGKYSLRFTHHGDHDPGGHASWGDGDRFGVVHGAITNLDTHSLARTEVIPAVLDRPAQVLPTLEGSFLVVAVDADADRIVLGQDKIGSRECYYAAVEDGVVFGSAVAPLLSRIDSPQIDQQSVSDVLLMGHIWGDRTMIEQVQFLRPAHYLEFDSGAVTTRRYWKPEYGMAAPGEPYLTELRDRLQTAMDRVASTLQGDVGLWLSGGLDSRITASELKRTADATSSFDVRTYTYEGNPPGKNLALAREVATELGFSNERVEFGPELVAAALPAIVDSTDGLLQWNTAKNLASVYAIDDPPSVMMEGYSGTLVGQHLARHHITEASTPAESMYMSEAVTDPASVRSVLRADVDPLESYRAEARFSDEETHLGTILDVNFQNYYARMEHVSNAVPRTRVGTRIPYADGDYLEHAARLPFSYRMGSVPFTGNRIPHGTTRCKFELIRRLDPELAKIRYERTGLPPTFPFPIHVAGFVGKTALGRLRSDYTYGGRSRLDEWYRTNDALRTRIDDLVEAACERPLFREGTLRDLQRDHHSGDGNHLDLIAPVTTIEQWLQRHDDDVGGRTPILGARET